MGGSASDVFRRPDAHEPRPMLHVGRQQSSDSRWDMTDVESESVVGASVTSTSGAVDGSHETEWFER